MAWDDDKSKGDTILSDDWDAMASDQKSHSDRHEHDGSDPVESIGNDTTYIEVDTGANEIRFYVNGELKQKWTA